MITRQEFCLALRTARERRGITLDEIAETTKIPAFMFAALERSDLRRWPRGLFRRSFFRDYARLIGVDVGETCEEFVRLFPDNDSPRPAREDLRLTLDDTWRGPRASVRLRLFAAVVDAAAVMLAAAALARVMGIELLSATAIVSMAYFALGTALVGESPAKAASARRPKWAGVHLIVRWAPERSWWRGVWPPAADRSRPRSLASRGAAHP